MVDEASVIMWLLMNRHLFIGSIVALIFGVRLSWSRCLRADNSCPMHCQCVPKDHRKSTEVSCLDLTKIPVDLPATAVRLKMTYNKLSRITKSDFAGCFKLSSVDLSFNRIVSIENGSFFDMRNLSRLVLSGNRLVLDRLPAGMFDDLANSLEELRIDDNANFTDYRGDLFGSLRKLRKLELDGLPSTPFPKQFSKLTSLKELTIREGLVTIKNETFAAFAPCPIEIVEIDTRTTLQSVEPLSFAHFKKMKELNLEYNRNLGLKNVSKAWWGLQNTSIKDLRLSSIVPETSKAYELGSDFFKYLNLTRIRSLAINRNDIVTVKPLLSASLPFLENLNLNENQIQNKINELVADVIKLRSIRSIKAAYQLAPAPNYRLSTHRRDISNWDPKYQNDGKGKASSSMNSGLGDYGEHRSLQKLGDCKISQSQPCQNGSLYSWDYLMSAVQRANIVGKKGGSRGQLEPLCVELPQTLNFLDLSEAIVVPLHIFPRVEVSGGKNLKKLTLDSNGLKRIEGPIIFKEPVSGLTLFLRDNHINCLAPDLLRSSASNGSELEALYLGGNNLGRLLELDTKGSVFRQYKRLKILELDRNGVKKLSKNVFSENLHLIEVKLSHNSLTEIDFEFSHLRKLQLLDMSSNLLSVLNETVTSNLTELFRLHGKNFKLNLKDNPLVCTCDTINFLRWMKKYRNKNLKMFDSYTCFYKNGHVTFKKLAKEILPNLEFECSKQVALIVIGATLAVVLVLAVLSAWCYRHRWEVRYMCLKLTRKGERYQRLMSETVDYVYDAFVVYDSGDRQWVNEHLLPQLEALDDGISDAGSVELRQQSDEQGGGRLRLCVHERDFPPGQEIIGNIWSRMECSRKVILVISKNFTMSHYCDYEMNLARMHSVEQGRNVLVPILLEYPDVNTASECLYWVLKNVTYVEWPRDTNGNRDDFWRNLRRSIRS